MIYLIRALVNYQIIVDSTVRVIQEMENTKRQTNFINNFLHPYLESDYAPYFLSHENNQLLPGERIVNITYTTKNSTDTQEDSATRESSGAEEKTTNNPAQRSRYLKNISKKSQE